MGVTISARELAQPEVQQSEPDRRKLLHYFGADVVGDVLARDRTPAPRLIPAESTTLCEGGGHRGRTLPF